MIRRHGGSGRNRLFVADNTAGGHLIIKQTTSDRAHRSESGSQRCAGAAGTRIAFTDDERAVVAYHVDRDARTIQELSKANGVGAVAALGGMGPMLASIHRTAGGGEDVSLDKVLPPIDPVPLRVWLELSGAGRELVRVAQRRPVLAFHYRRARSIRYPEGPIHGDIKPDNVLIGKNGPILVDWELSGTGPVGVDLGAVIATMLMIWTDQLPVDASSDPFEWVTHSELEFAAVARAALRLCAEYMDCLADNQQSPSRADIVLLAMAWVVGRTLAEASRLSRLPARHRVRLLVAENVVSRPDVLIPPL